MTSSLSLIRIRVERLQITHLSLLEGPAPSLLFIDGGFIALVSLLIFHDTWDSTAVCKAGLQYPVTPPLNLISNK